MRSHKVRRLLLARRNTARIGENSAQLPQTFFVRICGYVRLEGVCHVDELARALLQDGGLLGGEALHEKPCGRGEFAWEPLREFLGTDAKLGGQGGFRILAVIICAVCWAALPRREGRRTGCDWVAGCVRVGNEHVSKVSG
jgi:hypothetical protein